ncbi:hypothetical protein [Pseudomonas sp. No.117]
MDESLNERLRPRTHLLANGLGKPLARLASDRGMAGWSDPV